MRSPCLTLLLLFPLAAGAPVADAETRRELDAPLPVAHREATDWISRLSSAASNQASAPSYSSEAGLAGALLTKFGERNTAQGGTAGTRAGSLAAALPSLIGGGAAGGGAGGGKGNGAAALSALVGGTAVNGGAGGGGNGGGFMQDSLVVALLPAVMTAPGGFAVMADPTLILNPEIRAPILRHILLTQPVQAAILGKAGKWADEIIAVMGKPSGFPEDESETFHASVVSAIGRMLEPAQIDLLIHDHDYFRSLQNFLGFVSEEAVNHGMNPATMTEWKRNDEEKVQTFYQIIHDVLIPLVVDYGPVVTAKLENLHIGTIGDSEEADLVGQGR